MSLGVRKSLVRSYYVPSLLLIKYNLHIVLFLDGITLEQIMTELLSLFLMQKESWLKKWFVHHMEGSSETAIQPWTFQLISEVVLLTNILT